MTIKEQETYHSTHYVKEGKAACGHRFAQKLTTKKAFVTCPWCQFEIKHNPMPKQSMTTTPQIVSIITYKGLSVAFYTGDVRNVYPKFWSFYDLYLPCESGKEDDLLQAIQEHGENFNMQAWIDAQ